MNVITGLEPKVIQGFKGLWSRGSLLNVPEDHFSVCQNCIFPGQNLVGIREPLKVLDSVTVGSGEHVISAAPYAIIPVGGGTQYTDFLYLTDAGNLIDGRTNTILGNFTGGFANPDDMSCINLFGRIFISLKARGIAWENANTNDSSIHYYDGTNFANIAGPGPSTDLTLAQTSVGIVTAGVHFVAVSYIYKYGYISPPDPVPANINSDGIHAIDISAIPISSNPLVVGRQLLITAANGSEYFLMPGGTINNNTTTTFTYNEDDTALIESADFLFNVLTSVPNGSALKFYHGRLAVIGPHGVENNVLFSNQLQPEDFDVVNGIVQLPLDFQAMDPNTAVIINDTFYILKPNGTYAVQDNGGNPATWNVTSIDAGLGGWDTGVTSFGGNYTDILDNCLVASPRGLIMFTGSYQDTPLSFKIDATWKSINPKNFYLIQVAHDIWQKRVYIAFPSFGSNVNDTVAMMDYQEGLNPKDVKWSMWRFSGHAKVTRMYQGVYLITGSGAQNISNQLNVIFGDSNDLLTLNTIYDAAMSKDENLISITQEVDTAALSLKPGLVHSFLMMRLSLLFNQNLILQGFNLDKSINYDILGFSNNPIAIGGWVANTTAMLGSFILSGGHYQQVVQGGMTGSVIPAFNTSGGTTNDNKAIWMDTGIVAPLIYNYYEGEELERLLNITTERLIIKFANDITQSTSWFQLNRIDLYGQPMWNMRSALTQAS